MRLERFLGQQRPVLVAIAGPNGAGKSSFYQIHLSAAALPFINADVLAESFKLNAYAASGLADEIRRQLVQRKESFIFETVFSDPVGDKVKFLKSAEDAGYAVLLIFIGIADSEISEDRVALRVTQGGHGVPEQKLKERFPRILKNLRRAMGEISNVWIYDHSELDAGYRLVATRENRHQPELHGPVPAWLRPCLFDG